MFLAGRQKIEFGATKATGRRESLKENGQKDGVPNLVHQLYLTKISGSPKNYAVPDSKAVQLRIKTRLDYWPTDRMFSLNPAKLIAWQNKKSTFFRGI